MNPTRHVTFHVDARRQSADHPHPQTPLPRPVQAEPPQPPRLPDAAVHIREPHAHLGRRFTTWGTSESLGTLTEKILTGVSSRPLHALADRLHEGAHYKAANACDAFANGLGGTGKLIASAVSTSEELASNVVGAVARLPAVVALVAAESVMPAPIARACGQLGDRLIDSSPFMQRGTQVRLTAAQAARARVPAVLARLTCYSTPYRGRIPVDGVERASVHELPQNILPRGHAAYPDGTGKRAKFHYDPESGLLTGGPWAPLRVGVYIDRSGDEVTYVLVFAGLNFPRQKGLLKSLLTQAIGIEDSAFEDADLLVKAFKKKCQDDGASLRLVGHSLGGAFAQYAGIANDVQVTAFNSAGLSVHLRNKLGSRRIAQAEVEHFNSEDDWLSQKLEARFSPVITTQVGDRYEIEGASGHRMDAITLALDTTAVLRPALGWIKKLFNDVLQGEGRCEVITLDESQIARARSLGIQHPEHMRLLIVHALPSFPDDSVRLAIASLVSSTPSRMMTLDYWIWTTREATRAPEFERQLQDEFRRVRQFEEVDGACNFLIARLLHVESDFNRNSPGEAPSTESSSLLQSSEAPWDFML